MANLTAGLPDDLRVRPATTADKGPITRLLQRSPWSHLHVDWHTPGDWLGTPGFVVVEQNRATRRSATRSLLWPANEPEMEGCLSAAADPLPAAWVRVAAISQNRNLVSEGIMLAAMLEAVLPHLRAIGVTQLAWMTAESWPDAWLPSLGFEIINWIETRVKENVTIPPGVVNPQIVARPVQTAELPQLAAMEAAAFDPLWRHSAESLALAWRQSISFDVAEVDGQIVGFQYSSAGGSGAHLSRLTVSPAAQGMGVGSALLTRALEGYQRMGWRQVSLNTQVDNAASQRLYEKFGFRAAGERTPVWGIGL
ncbi:MAG: GNAT family N-acetyltransferase [Chloroflexota bacterium]